MSNIEENDIYIQIKNIIQESRNSIYKQINFTMVKSYWNIGKKIVEEEQNGSARAEYGKALIKGLSSRLTKEFGKGFSERNLYNMKKFYLAFSNLQTVSANLTWSHYTLLLRIKDEDTRNKRTN